MKTRILHVAAAFAALGMSASNGPTMSELGQQKMESVPTNDGYLYFSGYLDERDLPRDFPTIYFHTTDGKQTLTILASRFRAEFPVDRFDEAMAMFRGLVDAKAKRDLEAYERIRRNYQNRKEG